MNWIAKWIAPPKDMGYVCPRFMLPFWQKTAAALHCV